MPPYASATISVCASFLVSLQLLDTDLTRLAEFELMTKTIEKKVYASMWVSWTRRGRLRRVVEGVLYDHVQQ